MSTTKPDLHHLHGARIITTLTYEGEERRRGRWYDKYLCPACRVITMIPIPLEDEDEM